MIAKTLLCITSPSLLFVNTLVLPVGFDIDANSGSDAIDVVGHIEEVTTSPTVGDSSLTGYQGMDTDDYVAPVDTPARSASDPWDWPCYAPRNPGEHMHAVLPCSPRPSKTAAPDGPAPEARASRPVTVTRSQVSRLLVGGSGITRQPPSASTRLGMPVIVYTSPAPQTLTTTVLGTPVTITATPRTYTWSWADGTTTRTTTPFNVKAYTAVLTDDAEHAQGH